MSKTIKIISWNINSLRLRLGLLAKFVDQNQPDIICLQEIKVANKDFPLQEIQNLGFEFIEFSGEKSYNGVAILSKLPLLNKTEIDVLSYGHKRHISAEIKIGQEVVVLHNFYVPAGGDIPDSITNQKFDHKLKFVDWMAEFFVKQRVNLDSNGYKSWKEKTLPKIIILGDFNIAPLPNDVWSHQQMLRVVSHTPIEVEKLTKLASSLNFVDVHRLFTKESEKLYSWWSYRAKDPLGANRGRRLDHIWVSPSLKNNVISSKIHRYFRLENQPSDHVPIELVIDNNFG